MIAKVYQYMESQHMIAPGQRILAAVSGGADSMCLLQVLLELQKQMQAQAQKEMQQLPPQEKQVDFMVRVLHVHHGLRESAEGDLQYVKQFCERAGIPFQAVRVDAARYAAENGMSVEEAARHLRYEALEKAAAAWDAEGPGGDSALSSCAGQPADRTSRNAARQWTDHSASHVLQPGRN